ncbi:phage tail protein [Micromonospora sp. NPDC005806]|uniref:phage tail protein n=1 Tax=Micromonospora sp. NPDC005806 TaxID=3364234 RepID=UPI0036A46F24
MATKAMRYSGTKRDPLRNFNFRIVMGGVEVAACRKMSALEGSVHVTKFRAGNSLSSIDESMPGRAEYGNVTFEGGVTDDATFLDWAQKLIDIAHDPTRPKRSTEADFRKDIEVRILDLDGTEVRAYKLFHCFVTQFHWISDLMGDGHEVLIETLAVAHEGVSRIPLGGA